MSFLTRWLHLFFWFHKRMRETDSLEHPWTVLSEFMYCDQCTLKQQQLYGHLPLISQTTRTWRARHFWGCNGLLHANKQANAYIHLLCADTGCRQEDLLSTMVERDGCWERANWIRAVVTPWWWCHIHVHPHNFTFFSITQILFYNTNSFL